MKASKINLDLTKVESESSSVFSRVPAGQYLVVLAYSQFKEGKNPGAAGLQIGYMIEEGEHKGKMIGEYINIANQNEDAVKIGLGRLKRICELQGRSSLKLATDLDLIHKGKFLIDVELVENEYNGKTTEVNRVKKLLANEGSVKEEVKEIKKVQDEVKEEKKEKLPWE